MGVGQISEQRRRRMTYQEILQCFRPLYDRFPSLRDVAEPPLLAHYTSLEVLMHIVTSGQIWFSNPLFMNDLEELRFGAIRGANLFQTSGRVAQAAGTSQREGLLHDGFRHYFDAFAEKGTLDIYVLCLSEHDPADNDGSLSMWRAYASHGNGAALIFNTAPLVPLAEGDIPLSLIKVQYGSEQRRLQELDKLVSDWAAILARSHIPDSELHFAALAAIYAITAFALAWKHDGFREEKEWRVVYMPQFDPGSHMRQCLSYHFGPRGVEPKFKWELQPIPGIASNELNLDTLLDRIILGPSTSSALAVNSISRMLDAEHRSGWKSLLRPSTIPLRPVSG